MPIAELQVVGAPWLDRSNQTLAGIAGIHPDGGFVITSSIGTTDSSAAVVYQPPPGVVNEADSKGAQFAGHAHHDQRKLDAHPSGEPAALSPRRGVFPFSRGARSTSWRSSSSACGDAAAATAGGRTASCRCTSRSGATRTTSTCIARRRTRGRPPAAWTDLRDRPERFVDLRKKIQTAYLAGKQRRRSPAPASTRRSSWRRRCRSGVVSHRFAACDDGYMVYTVDPAVTAPNLDCRAGAGGRHRARGGVGRRVAAISPTDTLELWVDDVRLDGQVNTGGTAGSMSAHLNIGDFADFAGDAQQSRSEFPAARRAADVPVGAQHRHAGDASAREASAGGRGRLAAADDHRNSHWPNDPLYLSQTDISGKGIPGLRKPRNDLTTYSLTARRTTSLGGVARAAGQQPVANTAYTTGVDRTEYPGRQRAQSLGRARLSRRRRQRAAHDGVARLGRRRARRVAGFAPGRSGRARCGRARSAGIRRSSASGRDSCAATIAECRSSSPTGRVADDPSVSTASSRLWRNGERVRDSSRRTAPRSLGAPVAARPPRLRRHGAVTSNQLRARRSVRRERRFRARAVDVDERVVRAVVLVVVPAARRSRNAVRHAARSERAVVRHAAGRDRRRQRARRARLAATALDRSRSRAA